MTELSIGGPDPEQGPLRVLFVCEGNVCRSPAAQLLLAAVLPTSSAVATSAGVAARVGEGIADETARLLRAADVDPSGFVARALTEEMLGQADLVVVMTGAQRASVVRRSPAVLRRTWTLLDLAGTLRGVGLSLRDRPETLLAARTAGGGDVPDPWGRGAKAHRRTFDVVQRAVDVLAASVS